MSDHCHEVICSECGAQWCLRCFEVYYEANEKLQRAAAFKVLRDAYKGQELRTERCPCCKEQTYVIFG